MTFAVDKYVRIFLMRVNITLLTSWSYVKVFAFHRLICINLNSTNQTNTNRGVVTINPESGNLWFLTHSYALVTTFEKVPPEIGSTIFSHVCIVEGVLSKLNPQVENSVPKSHKITHSHKQRTVLEQQNKRKTIFEKNKGEHTRNGTLHIYCKLRQKHTHFLNYKRSIQKTDRSLR